MGNLWNNLISSVWQKTRVDESGMMRDKIGVALPRKNPEGLATERKHIMLTIILQHELSDSEACVANGSKTHRNAEGQAKRSKTADAVIFH